MQHLKLSFVYLGVDVQFWRSRKSLEGLSVRSVFFNVFQSLIVLLYILDNETNYVVIVSVFVGEYYNKGRLYDDPLPN